MPNGALLGQTHRTTTVTLVHTLRVNNNNTRMSLARCTCNYYLLLYSNIVHVGWKRWHTYVVIGVGVVAIVVAVATAAIAIITWRKKGVLVH